jgi:hypothetical protein
MENPMDHTIESAHALFGLFQAFPQPNSMHRTGRHIASIITQPQVARILPLLRNHEDRLGIMRMIRWWNGLDALEQMIHTSEAHGNDFFEIGLADNGVTIVVSIYREDDDCIFLRVDPNCDIVIREISLDKRWNPHTLGVW